MMSSYVGGLFLLRRICNVGAKESKNIENIVSVLRVGKEFHEIMALVGRGVLVFNSTWWMYFPRHGDFRKWQKKKHRHRDSQLRPTTTSRYISSAAISSRLPPSKFIGQSNLSDDRGATVALDAVLIEIAPTVA